MTSLMIAILVVLLLILAVLVGGFLWIRAKIRGVFKSISDAVGDFAQMAQALGGVTSFRMKLTPVSEPVWWHEDEVADKAQQLIERGFVDSGAYQMDNTDQIKIRTLVHEGERVGVVIYDTEAGTQVDVTSMYQDGSSFTVTSVMTGNLRKPPFMKNVKKDDLTPAQMYELLLAERPEGELFAISAENIARCIEDTYAREMNWRVDTGGFHDDEIRRMSGGDEDGEVSDMARTMLQSALSGEAATAVLETHRGSFDPGVVPEGAEDHQFIVVLNIADADDLTGNLPDVDMEDDDYEKREARAKELLKQHGPRAAFAKLLEENPRGSEVRKLMSVTDPVEADIYLRPMDVEEEYE